MDDHDAGAPCVRGVDQGASSSRSGTDHVLVTPFDRGLAATFGPTLRNAPSTTPARRVRQAPGSVRPRLADVRQHPGAGGRPRRHSVDVQPDVTGRFLHPRGRCPRCRRLRRECCPRGSRPLLAPGLQAAALHETDSDLKESSSGLGVRAARLRAEGPDGCCGDRGCFAGELHTSGCSGNAIASIPARRESRPGNPGSAIARGNTGARRTRSTTLAARQKVLHRTVRVCARFPPWSSTLSPSGSAARVASALATQPR